MNTMGAAFDLLPMADLAAATKTGAQWVFFKLIFDFLDNEINVFRDNLLGHMLAWASGAVLVLMSTWVLVQGYRIVTGRSREPMAALVTNTLRSVLIVTVATTFTLGSSSVYSAATNEYPAAINLLVTGDDSSPEDQIDKNLGLMTLAMAGIDLMATDDPAVEDEKDQAMLLTGIGVAGPSVVAGALHLLYKISMALTIGLGPLFILSLLFEQTRSLFSRWVYYGIGTMFSISVLSFMTAVATKMTGAVAAAFAAQYALALSTHSSLPDGISSMALQQGGLGLLLSILLVSTPPIASQFFQGALGNFSAYSAFGVTGKDASEYARNGRPAVPQADHIREERQTGPAFPVTPMAQTRVADEIKRQPVGGRT